MKIIKPPFESRWWHGRHIECPNCGQVVELEPDDEGRCWLQADMDELRLGCQCGQMIHVVNVPKRK